MAEKKCPQCGSLNGEEEQRCGCGYEFQPAKGTSPGQSSATWKQLSPDIKTAKNWYIWLWISPVFTIPTLIFLGTLSYLPSGSLTKSNYLIAVLGSALWHLILLIPALAGASEFIRWHTWQALLLAGLRTATALLIVLLPSSLGLGILVLIALWLVGNLWGQGQARRGDCSLMRWMGHGAGLPLPVVRGEPTVEIPSARSSGDAESPAYVDNLVETIRFDADPEKRRAALVELERLGVLEALFLKSGG